MASIALSELHAAGSELFQDSESFLNEMNDVDSIVGGTYGYVSDMSGLSKLAEAWVYTYGIGHIGYIAKSFSGGYGYGY
ncbi:hypothetical protein [Halotia branconii]|uniref:Uncharacterized protein n=1 Tax=Halotia branconii CENA392 TaxID=1539056 RepID=A0AAJ6NPT0_9CYAN|nr:hypothetical protein [Halotia branconii]WGV24305.1 hypothetical protein QI031_21290 [Halotia branconii CENA392]WGV24306.1 hypothetical protein QI031_21295 [Halotia branconii CENA392]